MATQGITSDPDVMMGKPVVEGTRITDDEMAGAFTVLSPGLVRIRPPR